jgi:hypothetical protein
MVIREDTANGNWLRDIDHFELVRDSIYYYIKNGWVRNIVSADFGDEEQYRIDFAASDLAKHEVIIPYMKEITNDRTFIDVGDNPEEGLPFGNGIISETNDLRTTERLFNNVEYYYKVVSFDEGDFLQPTPMKNNVGLMGLPNLVKTYPASDRPSNSIKFDVIETSGFLGGLFNFKMFSIDDERAAQLFAGDTIEVEFTPHTFPSGSLVVHRFGADKDSAIRVPAAPYQQQIKITNTTKNIVLFDGITGFEITPCFPAAPTT